MASMTDGKRVSIRLICFIIFMSVFCIMVLFNLFLCRYIHLIELVTFLVPPAVFYFLWRAERARVENRPKRIAVSIILIILFTAMNTAVLLAMLATECVLPVRDAVYYQRLLRLYGYPGNETMAHFPKAIPESARDVRFYELPQFLQGGSEFFLKYTAGEGEADRIYNNYASQARAIVNSSSRDPWSTGYLDSLIYSYDGTGYPLLPDDFDVLVLGVDYSNHGYCYGIAVSRKRGEVVYWAEEW